MPKSIKKNLRDMIVDTSDGTDVKDTNMLKGEAKDSLSGKNSTTQYETTGSARVGPLGGENAGN